MWAVLLSACTANVPEIQLSVTSCAPIPVPRASACATVLGDCAYIFGGRDSTNNYRNDLCIYNSLENTWTILNNTPLKKRTNAAIIAAGNSLYLGLGYSAPHAYTEQAYQRDWWRYTPSSGEWKALAEFPNKNVIAATLITDGHYIYAFYGCGFSQQKEVWRYSIADDEWTQIPSSGEPLPRAFGCTGAVVDGMLYFGTGFNSQNLTNWYMVTLPENRWTPRTNIPGKGREFSACTATKEYIYLFGGRYFGGDMTGGEVFDTYLRYAPATDKWTSCGTMPCGTAENQVAFTINGKAYFGLGEDANGKMHKYLYRIE